MRKSLATLIILISASISLSAQNTVMVGGEAMYSNKNIIENAVKSQKHTILVAAVKAAGLAETLQSDGPFTVFAPTDDAFENLPEGTISTLMRPENKSKLAGILTYHVVSGKMDYTAIKKAIRDGNGMTKLNTVSGGILTAKLNGPNNIILTDENGNTSNITTYNVFQSNGVIHVIDSVVLPK